MPHHHSVFHAVLKLLPWETFEAAVARHGAADRARSFGHRSHLVAMLYGQLAGAQSLREIEAGLRSHAARLYHLGARPVARATLADANRSRPAAVFADLLGGMLQQARRGLRRAMDGTLLLLDSTSLALDARSAGWARYSATACGAKLHVLYDADAGCPAYFAVTPARVNDITAAQAMPVRPGATYVFDLGYYDYRWWATLADAQCRIVTRLKRNTPLAVTETRPVPTNGPILADRVGHLPTRQASRRHNPVRMPMREVTLRLDTGRTLRILTNDRDAPAEAIADLYKRRWTVELFFRWIKQTLRVTRFLGTSANAVRLQVAVALIAYLLLRLAQQTQATIAGPLAFARLVRSNLMHRRPLDQLLAPPLPPATPRQLSLFSP